MEIQMNELEQMLVRFRQLPVYSGEWWNLCFEMGRRGRALMTQLVAEPQSAKRDAAIYRTRTFTGFGRE